MKILFISTNRFRIKLALPMPIGLACVIGQIDENEHPIRVLDMMFSEDPTAELETALSEFEPDLVAISIRNLDDMSYPNPRYFLPEAKEIIELCRSSSKANVVIGGAAFSTAPAAVFDYLKPDFGIIGEGEIPFPRLVAHLDDEEDWTGVPGLVWRSKDGIRMNPSAVVEDWDALNFPRRDLFDARKYAEAGGFSNIVIKQGCPMRCLYCEDPHRMGRTQRKKSPKTVADELESMSEELGDVPIFFFDTLFNKPMEHAKEVCRAIIDRDLKIRWTTMIHPAFVDEELAELMHAAGCAVVSLGCDSGSERMLKVLRKDITKEQLETSIRVLEKFGIGYLLAILIGGPGEDRQSVEETIDFLRDKKAMFVTFTVGIRILPNTALAEMAVEEGLIPADDPLMEPRFYVSPGVRDWAVDYVRELCSQHPNWDFAQEVFQTRPDTG
jgi:radical SAM superfamily enzyme YgiQ (UPF0313 family)